MDVKLLNDRKTMQLKASNSNDVKADEMTERMKLYNKSMNLFRFLTFLYGIRVSYQWKPHRYILFDTSIFFLCFTGFTIGYSIYVHSVNGDFMKILEPLAISGYFVSCCLKMHQFLRNRHHMFALAFSLRRFCTSKIFGRRAEIVEENQRQTWSLLLRFGLGCPLASVLYAVTPVVIYLYTNEIIPLMPVEVVICDQSQTSGFVRASFIHLIIGYYGTSATIVYGAFIIFCISNYTFLVNIIGEDFLELDRMWNSKSNVRLEYKRAFLKNVCKKRQDMNKYAFELTSY